MRTASLFTKVLPLVAALAAAPACAETPAVDKSYTPTELKADFDDLYKGLNSSHFNLYARRAKTDYDGRFRAMRRGIKTPMTRTEAQVYFQKFAAYGKIAHSNIAFPSDAYEAFRAGGGKAMPLAVRFIGEKLFVADDLSGLPDTLAGARILSIDGIGARNLERRLSAHLSADNEHFARTMYEFRFAQLLWLEFGERPSFAVEVETASGERRSVDLPARTRAEMTALPPSDAFQLDWDERRHAVIDGVGYLRPGPFYDNRPDAADMWDNAAFRAFIDAAFADFMGRNVPAVLIDLRANPGGDNSFSDHMVAWFADRPFKFASHFYVKVSEAAVASNAKRLQPGDETSITARFAAAYAGAKVGDVIDFDLGESMPRAGDRYRGKIYMLIDRHSYSNTVTVAALAQDYGFATILGEETADLATTYGAMEQFALPNTGIEVGFPKARIIRPNGSTDPRGVVPDVAIASPLRASEDEMLKEALARVVQDLNGG
jgi:hypothetical protein